MRVGTLRSIARLGPDLRTLLLGILLFHTGWYLLLPFVAVLFTERRGLTPMEAGLVLAAQSLAVLFGSVFGGFMADRSGRKPTLIIGLVIRAAGLAALGMTGGLWFYLAASAVAGLGGGLYGPAAKAAIAILAGEGDRNTVFSLRGVAANVGVSLGPLLGAMLMHGSMLVLFGASALVHLLLALLTWVGLTEPRAERQAPAEPFRDVITDLPYVAYSHASGLAWMLFTQLAIAMPLYAARVLHLEGSIGLVWTVISLVVIAFQVPFSRTILVRVSPMAAMALGSVLLGGGLGLVGLAHSLTGLMGATLVFVVGEMFLMPTADTAVALMARRGAEGAYFGLASLAWGLGEGLGNLGGGALMQVALLTGRLAVPWVLYAVAGAAIGALFVFLGQWGALRERLERGGDAQKLEVQVFRPGYPTPKEGLPAGGSPDGPED